MMVALQLTGYLRPYNCMYHDKPDNYQSCFQEINQHQGNEKEKGELRVCNGNSNWELFSLLYNIIVVVC